MVSQESIKRVFITGATGMVGSHLVDFLLENTDWEIYGFCRWNDDFTNIKDCQKYIYLRPTPKQLYFSDDENLDTIFSDISKKKSYKMRLTSKGTGKKIDINFSFKKKFDMLS